MKLLIITQYFPPKQVLRRPDFPNWLLGYVKWAMKLLSLQACQTTPRVKFLKVTAIKSS